MSKSESNTGVKASAEADQVTQVDPEVHGGAAAPDPEVVVEQPPEQPTSLIEAVIAEMGDLGPNKRADEYGQVWVKAHHPELPESNTEFIASSFDESDGPSSRGWVEGWAE